ncbi:MAG: ribbon-helix-helix protein, CopG family [Myxococcota bacterium]
MKVKTSITLSSDAVRAVDRIAGKTSNRSRVIEQAIRELAARRERDARDARDRAILDSSADALNAEMADVLLYQVDS